MDCFISNNKDIIKFNITINRLKKGEIYGGRRGKIKY
jgi:hypothetical protein